MKIDAYLAPCTKLNSKSIKNLSTIQDILNLMEEKVGNMLELIGIGKYIL